MWWERGARESVLDALADISVVVLNGARQVGKTTLVRSLSFSGSHEFVTLDDSINREAAHNDPAAFITRPVDTVIIDEAQLQHANDPY